MSREQQGVGELNVIAEPSGKRLALWVCGLVLFSLLVLEMTTGCGRKKPPRPLKQNTAQVLGSGSLGGWPWAQDLEGERVGG